MVPSWNILLIHIAVASFQHGSRSNWTVRNWIMILSFNKVFCDNFIAGIDSDAVTQRVCCAVVLSVGFCNHDFRANSYCFRIALDLRLLWSSWIKSEDFEWRIRPPWRPADPWCSTIFYSGCSFSADSSKSVELNSFWLPTDLTSFDERVAGGWALLHDLIVLVC